MPQQNSFGSPEQREETTDPANPPNAVVRPAARTAALVTFLGGIVLLFVVVAAVLFFWTATDRPGTSSDAVRDPSAVGTTGEPRSDSAPGGFDPAPGHGNTESELEYRGVNQPKQGPMPGLTTEQDGKTEKKP